MLDGKVAIITGASSGIGAALAVQLSREGAAVILAARRRERIEKLAGEINGSGFTALPVRADVTSRADAEMLVRTAIERYGRLDILVNNAGRGHFAGVEETTDEMIRSMFELNVYSLWYTTRPALTQMKEQGSGHIINVASLAGKLGFPFNSAYVAAKHACVGFTHALRMELVETGIHVTVVCPAGVLTEWAGATEGGSMLPFFSESGPLIRQIAAERQIALPPVEGAISAEQVAGQIVNCIYAPVAELYTHRGSAEFVRLAAENRAEAEKHQLPVVLGERIAYELLKKS